MFYPARGAGLRGVGYISQRASGPVFTTWPKPYGKARSAKQQKNWDTFSAAMIVIKNMDGLQQQFAREVSVGAPLLPRDVLMTQLYQRAFYFIMPDGRRYFSMAAIQDVSLILDTIGQTKGDIMFRDTTFWKSLAAGTPGDLLTIDPATELPMWLPAPSPPAASHTMVQVVALGTPTANTGGLAAVGSILIPTNDMVIRELFATITAGGTETYAPFVAEVSNDTSGATISSIQIGPTAGLPAAVTNQSLRLPFSVGVSLQAGHVYVWGCIRKDGSGTAVNHVFVCGGGVQAVPIDGTAKNLIAYSSNAPAVGRAYDFYQTSEHLVQVHLLVDFG